ETSWGAAVSAGTGDNMGAALGLGLEAGDVAISIGTSGTAFAVSSVPAADPSGAVAGFADATGRFLPLVCTLNGALVLSAAAALVGSELDGLSALALAAEAGAGGETLARAAVESLLASLAEAADLLAGQGVPQRRVLLIGGASRSAAVRALAPGIFGAPVLVPAPGEDVARGAARQAAWALAGTADPPQWPPFRPAAEYTGPAQPE